MDVPTVRRSGTLSTDTGLTEIDFSRELTMDYESEAVLLTLLGQIQSKKTKTHKFMFAVDRQAPRLDLVNGAVVAGAVGAEVSVIVDHGTYFNDGDVIEVPDTYNDATHTNQLYVRSVSSNTLTCVAFDPATYGVCTIDDDVEIRRLTTATVEGGEGTTAKSILPNIYTQYVHKFEDYYRLTDIKEEDQQYTGPERTRLRENFRKKHVIDQEVAAFISKPVEDLSTATTPRRQMGGLESIITSNILNYGATLGDDELYDFMTLIHNPAYSAGSRRLVLASGDLLGSIQKLAKSGLRITPKDTTWGPSINVVHFAGKVWEFAEAPILSQYRPGWGVVIHPRFIRKRTFIPTKLRLNVQSNKATYIEDGWVSYWGLEVRMEESMGWIRP